MVGPLLLDSLCAVFILCDVEHIRLVPGNVGFLRADLYDYAISHSLLMSIVWSLAFGGGYWILTRARRASVVLAVGVFSHWILDVVTHVPDLAIYPGGARLGLGLWRSTELTVLVECTMLFLGVASYVKTTAARDASGSYGLGLFVTFLLAIYALSIGLRAEHDSRTIGWLGVASISLFAWVHGFDRHRVVRRP